MVHSKTKWNWLVPFFVCLFLFSCTAQKSYEGKYAAAGSVAGPAPEIYIELKANGQGIWQVRDDQADFTWSIKGNEIRLHLKSGGILTGRIENSAITVKLPATRKLMFQKMK